MLAAVGAALIVAVALTGSSCAPSRPATTPTSGSLVYVTDHQTLFAVRLSDGSVAWRHEGEEEALVADGVIYARARQENLGDRVALEALRPSDGAVMWRATTDGDVRAATKDVVYLYTFFGPDDPELRAHVVALNAHTGAQLWTYYVGGAANSFLAATDDTVYVYGDVKTKTEDAGLAAVSAADGKLRWTYPEQYAGNTTPPVAAGSLVYVGLGNGVVDALRATDGQFAWRYASVGGGNTKGLAVANGVVYASANGSIVALDANNGALLWKRDALKTWQYQGTTLSEDALVYVANGAVYVSTDHARLLALGASDGAPLWTDDFSRDVAAAFLKDIPVAVKGGLVVFGVPVALGEVLYAVHADTGKFAWRVPLGRFQLETLG